MGGVDTVPVLIEDVGEGWFASSVPSEPGVRSQGRTPEEAYVNALDARRELAAWASSRGSAGAELHDVDPARAAGALRT